MKRRIAIIVGSDSDLSQCSPGLEYLKRAVEAGSIEVVDVITASIHRNTDKVLDLCRRLSGLVDVVIVGAGWANHLTGTVDAYLRYTLKNDQLVVVGVAFADPDNTVHTEAAKLSISEVPGTWVVFNNYVGRYGFFEACMFAVSADLPVIKLKKPKLLKRRTLVKAIEVAYQAEQLEKQQKKGR
ncbi:MAG: AIR carboxylase family protein [Patescibacteria group bacterium]